MYRGKKTDLIGREVEVAEIKDRDVAPNKLKKEIAGQLAKIRIYKSRTTIKRTIKNI